MTIQEFNKTKIGIKRPPFSKEWRENMSKAHLGKRSTKKAIEKVANAKGIGISTAARMLIRERLAQLNII